MPSPNDAPKPLTPGQADGLAQAIDRLTDAVKGRGASRPTGRPWWVQFAAYGAGAAWEDDQAPPQTPPQAPPQAQPNPRRGGWWRKYVKAAGQPVTPPTSAPPKPPQSQKASAPPWVKAAKTPNWRRRARPWNWNTTKTFAAYARARGGATAGRATAAGLNAAGKALQHGWPVQMALRSGLTAAAASMGPTGIAVGLLAAAAVKATQSLNDMAKGQVDYARSLSHASAQMALVIAERDIQETMRNREKGDRLATSARTLTQAEQFKEDNTKEIDILIDKGKNYIGAAWEVFKAGLFLQMNLVAGAVNRIEEMISGAVTDRRRNLAFDEWAKEAQKMDEERQKNKDPRWQPNPHRNQP